MIVTNDDRMAWRALPYQQSGGCRTCGKDTRIAGLRRASMACVECFAKKRHRRLGQLRARAAQLQIGDKT